MGKHNLQTLAPIKSYLKKKSVILLMSAMFSLWISFKVPLNYIALGHGVKIEDPV